MASHCNVMVCSTLYLKGEKPETSRTVGRLWNERGSQEGLQEPLAVVMARTADRFNCESGEKVEDIGDISDPEFH